MCIHFEEDDVDKRDQPTTSSAPVATTKVAPLNQLGALTPDEASVLAGLISAGAGDIYAKLGVVMIKRRNPQALDTLFAKLTAQLDALTVIQSQYPGFPAEALPEGVVA